MATASMSDRRQALAALAAARGDSQERGRTWKRAALVLLLLTLLAAVVLWWLGFFSKPRELVAIERLIDEQVVTLDAAARTGAAPDTGPGFGAVMQQVRELPREYREQAGRQLGRLFEARERAEMVSYFALPPEKRQAELDRRIKADEDRRKSWQAERAKREQQAGGGQTAASGGGGGEQRGGPGGPGGGGPGGGQPGGRRGGGGTEESRNERMKQQIDHTTPEQRAQRAEYRRAVEERRQQLGLGPGGRRT